jgi:predicted small secreted protein
MGHRHTAAFTIGKSKPKLRPKTKPNRMIKKLLLAFFAAVSLLVGVTACHTVHGAGEDISSAGDTIQNNTPPP